MISFESDYVNGAHPEIIKHLIETNDEILTGYGFDKYCDIAADKIRTAFGAEDADVRFLVGGTQTNQLIICSVLKPYQGVIAAKTGHVSLHEAGAIECTGHKVIELDGENGKLKASVVRDYLETFFHDGNHEHMVEPGMVYISFPTEYGTLYTKSEMNAIHEVCKEYDIKLFVDGARLGYGLCSYANDIQAEELSSLCDIFYVGGTKVGALCGEAVVFTHHGLPSHFLTLTKQHGALLAKGRLLGVQFDAMFTDNLYFRIGKHAIDLAEKMKQIFIEKGYQLFIDSPTNQQFVVMDNAKWDLLKNNIVAGFWEKYDDSHTVYRFATSWSTTESDIEELSHLL